MDAIHDTGGGGGDAASTSAIPGATYVSVSDADWEASAEAKRLEIEGVNNETAKKVEDDTPPKSDAAMPPSTSSDAPSPDGSVPGFAFCLPNLDRLPADFRHFLERDLFEAPTQRRLENSRHLNWWSSIGARLYPLSTTGDGNCLLHAACLGMYGLHDRQLLLRNALYEILMKGSRRNALWRRWKWAESRANEAVGVALTDEEWATEWRNVVGLASPTPRKQEDAPSTSSASTSISSTSTGESSTAPVPSTSTSSEQIYEGLEAIHVFALAHVLKRPIVVVSDTVLRNANGEELSPIDFGGVYLPLECPPEQCHRSPLVLCYDSAHFSPLVSMRDESNLQQIIPIIDANRNLLPLHFAVDPGPDFTWWRDEEDERIAARVEPTPEDMLGYMNEYMDLVRIDIRRGSARKTTPIRRESSLQPAGSSKSMTLASTGSAAGKEEKKRILNEITQQVRRTFRLQFGKSKENTLDVKMVVDALARTNCVVAARLNGTSHEYMDELATDYIKRARKRFADTAEKQQPGTRARLGRSFSASTLALTCIAPNCEQLASQATNFFCTGCLERQKALMTSFSSDGARTMRRIIAKPSTSTSEEGRADSRAGGEAGGGGTSKSTTMPSLSARGSASAESTDSTSKAIVFDVTSSGGESKSVPLAAVADENGVTHYFIPDETPDSVAHQPRLQAAH